MNTSLVRLGRGLRHSSGILHAWPTLLLLATAPLVAQVPDAPAPVGTAPTTVSPSAPAANSNAPGKKSGKSLGGDLPIFDPATETVESDRGHWNINNNRLFEARFEKYLNAPEDTSAEGREYQKIIRSILDLLAPGKATPANVDRAFQNLSQGSRFDIDSRLCDALASAIYSAWTAQSARDRLAEANKTLDSALRQAYWDAQHAGTGDTLKTAPKTPKDGQPVPSQAGFAATSTQAELTKHIAELEALKQKNAAQRELTLLESKIQFQALMVQFFVQRRYQHVLMATSFYRTLFNDGDTKINVGDDLRDFFARSSGMPPTVGTLDALADEAIRDVREGVAAFELLLSKNEMASASKRLAEAVAVGEYMPEVRTLALDKKRQALAFVHQSNQLISALDVKDYELAEQLVKEIRTVAHDFDSSKPTAAIETVKSLADIHLQKARNAAFKNDNATLETEITAATELWPRNPALAAFTKLIFSQSDGQTRTLLEFDMLAAQKNFRQIFDDRARFLAAVSLHGDKEKQRQLEAVLNDVQTIDLAINQANLLARQTNFPGAWESVEKIAAQFPNDTKLNQARADLTTQAADFVRTLRGAQSLEKKDQVGASLAWYLKAQRLYPQSELASEGVNRLSKMILSAS